MIVFNCIRTYTQDYALVHIYIYCGVTSPINRIYPLWGASPSRFIGSSPSVGRILCSGGTHMVAPEAYKPYVGGNSNRCGTWCQSLRLQGLALGPGENPARTRGRADKP